MVCPYCQQGPVWFSHSWVRGFFRMLVVSRKRYCFNCHRKWTKGPGVLSLSGAASRPTALAVVLSVILVLLAVILVNSDPVNWVKTYVLKSYEGKYGKYARQKLWEDFGVFYWNKDSAKTDFDDHNKIPPRGL